jgi:polygalacturonase
MRRRDFLSRSLAISAMTGLTGGKILAETPTGWAQLPHILARIVPPVFPDRDFDITDFGAIADGVANCLPAITAAIAACNKAGGGRVVVPAGTYAVHGPIHLLSNVNLHVSAGAYLTFGIDAEHYLPVVEVRWQGVRCYNYSPLIYAYQQENIAVTGSGFLDGQASMEWYIWLGLQNNDWIALQQMGASGVPVNQRVFGKGHYLRPTFFEPYQCRNVLVEDVTFANSPFWTLHPTFCTNVTLRNVTVLPGETNDDGCDPDSCTDVLIEGCSFTTSDDNVSVKAGSGPDAVGLPPCTNIVFMNCRALGTIDSAFTMGSSTTGNIENIFFENCVVGNCIAAFYIKSNTDLGGSVQNVFIRSCTVIDCHHLLFMDTGYLGVTGGSSPPLYKNINMESVICEDALYTIFWFEGLEALPIQGVTLTDISMARAGSVEEITYTSGLVATNIKVGGREVGVSA